MQKAIYTTVGIVAHFKFVKALAVSGSQGARLRWFPVAPGRAARRYIARPEGRPGRESGRTHFLHILGFG